MEVGIRGWENREHLFSEEFRIGWEVFPELELWHGVS